MSTIRKILKRSLIVAGILTKNEAMSSSEAEDANDTLNAMLSNFSNESMLITARTEESFTLTGAAKYTIGTGGNFNTTRPIAIVSAYVRNGGIDYPLEIISDTNYNSIQDKSTSGLPDKLFYDGAYPLGNITLSPVPIAGYTLTLLSEKPMATLGLDDEFSFPAGWEEMIVYNLALRLCLEYAVAPTDVLVLLAREAKGNVKSAIMKNRPLKKEVGGVQNIYTGYN
jgi:hypothetical protein